MTVCPILELGPAMKPADAAAVVLSEFRCAGYPWVGLVSDVDVCDGPLEVHEVCRGVWRQACLPYPELRRALCRRHHRWVTENPEAAFRLGEGFGVWLVFGPMSERWLTELGVLRAVNVR